MPFGLYNPEKFYTERILKKIQKTWKGKIFIETGYPIIKESNGYYLEHVDGTGTKGSLHWLAGSYEEAAIDAFAMNVNDLAILGFKPRTLNCHLILQEEKEDVIISVINKLSDLCLEYDVIFTGGETAILNTLKGMEIGIHMTGFANRIINTPLKEGDLVYGHLSTGIHSNGLSLARKLLNGNINNFLLEELTTPTAIYFDVLQRTDFVKKRMHITGGAFTKLKKLISSEYDLLIDLSQFRPFHIFELLFKKLDERIKNPSFEMLRTFNCGIGFIEIIDPRDKERFEQEAPKCELIGEVLSNGNGKINIISPFDKLSIQY